MNKKESNEYTLLYYVVIDKDNIDIIKLLINNGANVNERNIYG
jgi:ankyrin repeat protein